ncbi:MAG TPA: Asp-tRNA(Asn)/Glu-tRNA(Gln) amidotransferase subunit GatC [Candidatus Limosilactobacillus faecipullorum]|nr:Asp-tRNA(Asn)/Glu-tRNA(Gln) amidotransferase subunit GatC [Candidatus Limosilactobacillus faecipullorum]
MAEKLGREAAKHVAELAKLSFTDEELDQFVPQLEDTMHLFDDLQKMDTTGVEPMYSPTQEVNVMREDVAVPSGQKDALLANAPETDKGLIKVPAIIDESED